MCSKINGTVVHNCGNPSCPDSGTVGTMGK